MIDRNSPSPINAILFVSFRSHYPDVIGGVEISSLGLANVFLQHNFSCTFICRQKGTHSALPFGTRKETIRGMSFIRCKGMRLHYFFQILSSIIRIKPVAIIFDSSSCTSKKQFYFAALCSLFAHVHLIVSYSSYWRRASSIPHVWKHRCINGFSHVWPNSDYSARQMEAKNLGFRGILQPQMDTSRFACNSRSPRFITYVNTHKAKGYDILQSILSRCPDYQFLVITALWGDDALVNPLPQYDNLTIEPANEDIRHILERTTLLLVPSQDAETFGMICIEAQYNGIPVICSDAGALPDTIGEGGISISPRDDVSSYVEAIHSLMKDPSYYQEMSVKASNNARKIIDHTKEQTDTFLNLIKESCP